MAWERLPVDFLAHAIALIGLVEKQERWIFLDVVHNLLVGGIALLHICLIAKVIPHLGVFRLGFPMGAGR